VHARRSLDGVWDANFAWVMEAHARTPNLIATEQEAQTIVATVAGGIEKSAALDPEVPGLLESSNGLPIRPGPETHAPGRGAGRRAATLYARSPQGAGGPPKFSTDNPSSGPVRSAALWARASRR